MAAARAWASGEITVGQARLAALAAHAAARETNDGAARAAARSAGHAAATAHVAGHARHAGVYAIKAADADQKAWLEQRLEARPWAPDLENREAP